MTRRVLALLGAGLLAWVLAGDALGPFVSSGAPLSASAMRAALDARAEAISEVRGRMIELRQRQVALRNRVFAMEERVAVPSALVGAVDPRDANVADPWTEAGIVAGEVADAELLNAIFDGFVEDVTSIRDFITLLVRDQEPLLGRIEALEATAAIEDPPALDLLAPNEDEVGVPHVFTTGAPMRASEMNANLLALDGELGAESGVLVEVEARQAIMEARIEALEALLGISVRDYVVGPGVVATVTSIEGVIEGYDGGAVDATFAGLSGIGTGCPGDDPGCQPTFTPSQPWVPTSIDELGRFTVALPASPTLDGGGGMMLCDEGPLLALNGVIYVHDAPFGQPGSSPTSSFVRYRLEDPKEPIGILADAMAVVLYAYTTASSDLTCVDTAPNGDMESLVLDVDVRLRSGWNVMTWLQRSEGDEVVFYVRTGEPDGLVVPWAEPEPLF